MELTTMDPSSHHASNSSHHDIESGTSRDRRTRHLNLYQAALNGDWEIAKAIYNDYPQEINAEITKRKDTVLHLAVAANKTQFVKELINFEKTVQVGDSLLTYKVDLDVPNRVGNTAFCMAAASGEKQLVVTMLAKKPELAMKRGSGDMLPIYMAALLGHKEIVSVLYKVVNEQIDEADCKKLFVTLIDSDIYEVALDLLDDLPSLATARDRENAASGAIVGETALHAFARKTRMPSKGFDRTPVGFWNKMNLFKHSSIKKKNKEMNNQAKKLIENMWNEVILLNDTDISQLIGAPSRLIFTAAKQGNHELLEILIRKYPDLVFKVDAGNNYSIFHYAILYRHEEIFKLIHEIGSIKNVITTYKDESRNNMLHLAAKMPAQSRLNVVPGAALQLQRELLWFEEVKKVVQPRHFEEENRINSVPGSLPETLFMEEHEPLREAGEKWMINTANNCVVVAALIVTVVFAAAFTVPGGYDQNSGYPIFLHELAFKFFAIFDALSLVFSITSVLTFLSILTSRYAVSDFLSSLPNKLMIGISTLFISILAMMVSFVAAFFVIFKGKLLRIAIPVAVVAGVPIVVFAWQQYRLFIDVFKSTYLSKSLFKPNKKALFSARNPEKSWWSRLTKSKTA